MGQLVVNLGKWQYNTYFRWHQWYLRQLVVILGKWRLLSCDICGRPYQVHQHVTIGSSLRTEIETENLWFSWWKVILFIPPGKILLFSAQISHFWAENTFFLTLFSRRERVGNTNQSIFPVPLVQLSPIFVHMVLVSHPTYPAKNFLIESPLVYFLVCVLIKITILVEISSWPGRRELPIRDWINASRPCQTRSGPRCTCGGPIGWEGISWLEPIL